MPLAPHCLRAPSMTEQKSPDVLNLDDIQPLRKVIEHLGVRYEMREVTVSEFIESSRQAKAMEEERIKQGKDITPDEFLERMVEMVKQGFPDIPDEVLNKMGMAKLSAVFAFIINDGSKRQEAAEKKPVSRRKARK